MYVFLIFKRLEDLRKIKAKVFSDTKAVKDIKFGQYVSTFTVECRTLIIKITEF